jgi:type IV pilus assembly protein PilF
MEKMAEYQKKFGADFGKIVEILLEAGQRPAASRSLPVAPWPAGRPAPAPGAGSGRAELKTASDQTAAKSAPTIRLQLAVGYYQQGKYDIALDEVKQAIAADPSYADAYGMRALIYTAMGENGSWPTTITGTRCAWRRAIRTWPTTTACSCARRRRAGRGDAAVRRGAEQPRLPLAGERREQRRQLQPEDKNTTRPSATCSKPCVTPDLPATRRQSGAGLFRAARLCARQFFINRLTEVAKLDSLSADVLWLAIRVQHKLGDTDRGSQPGRRNCASASPARPNMRRSARGV